MGVIVMTKKKWIILGCVIAVLALVLAGGIIFMNLNPTDSASTDSASTDSASTDSASTDFASLDAVLIESTSTVYIKGTRCTFGPGSKAADLPEPYRSQVLAGDASHLDPETDEWPLYSFGAVTEDESGNPYDDPVLSVIWMFGGEPGDVVYNDITFGMTEKEVEECLKEADIASGGKEVTWPEWSYAGGGVADLYKNIFKAGIGEDYKERIKYVRYTMKDILNFDFEVFYCDGEVYMMYLKGNPTRREWNRGGSSQ